MNTDLIVLVISSLFVCGWISIFFHRHVVSIIQGVVLIILSEITLVLYLTKMHSDFDGIYLAYLSLVIVNIIFILIVKLSIEHHKGNFSGDHYEEELL